MLTAKADQPYGYGRIIRNRQGHVEKIVEQKDASAEESAERNKYRYVLF